MQALQGMTVNAAWAAGEEAEAGRLAVGRRADLTVLADDPLRVPDTGLAGLPVVLTVVGGRVTYRGTGG
ncbi:amidohydrolase family protein [Streptomyces sp. NPDC001393]